MAENTEIKNNHEEEQDTPEKVIGEREYVIFANPEKKDKRRLGPYGYMPLSTSRILLSGLPGVGKRNLILNMIHKMEPKPSCIHIVHIDPLTTEYDQLMSLGVPTLVYPPEEFPTAANIEDPFGEGNENSDVNFNVNFNEADDSVVSSDDESADTKKPPKGSPLVIVDEITTDQLGKIGASRFERMVNYVCTHRDTTLICSIQSMMNLPPKVRRSFNHFALWKQNDVMLNKIIAQRCGIGLDFLDLLFSACANKYEFIYIDLDEDRESPMRYRLNWLYPIVIEDVQE